MSLQMSPTIIFEEWPGAVAQWCSLKKCVLKSFAKFNEKLLC